MLYKFKFIVVLLLHISLASAILSNRTEDFVDLFLSQPNANEQFQNSNKCTSRLHTSLEKLRKRQAHLKSMAYIDLSGYALHQTLRHLPLDMYVTDIRVRTPGVGDWVRIQKCQFSNRENRMTAQLLFNDLTVSGNVQLLDDNEILKNSYHPVPREFCRMSLRLQRAGLGINAFPTRGRSRGIDVRTETKFMDPKFLSVHAYGCKLHDIFKRSEIDVDETLESYSSVPDRQISTKNDHFESQVENFPHAANHSTLEFSRSSFADVSVKQDKDPEVRIITLNPNLRTSEDSKWLSLHNEHETNLNDFHRNRILGSRLHTPTERDRLKAVLHVQNLIAQQANHVFQTQGPFSNMQKPLFKPFKKRFPQPQSTPAKGQTVISTITELDENLSPIGPVPQRPFEALFSQNGNIQNPPLNPNFNLYFEEVSREMEDVFLRGIKTLLTRYVEKQLEIPLKEALMVNIGYTVSYG